MDVSDISISGPTQVNESLGAQYNCTAYYSNGSTSDVTSSASWSESSSYASISSSGYLTTSSVPSDQPCTITASYGGKSDTHNITIKNVVTLSYITISGPTQVNESSGAQYTCTAYYSNGSTSDVTNIASWSVSSLYSNIYGSGYLTTSSVPSDQPCTITASYGGKSDTHNITIKNDTLSYITISGPTQVNERSGAMYTCTAYYSNGSTSDVTNIASWSVSSLYSNIYGGGYLTTSSVPSDQSCTITACYGGKSDTLTITIKMVDTLLRVITPNGGETWYKGNSYTITWNTGGLGGNVAIGLYKNGVYTCAVTGTNANDGSYYWTVPTAIPSGTDYKLKIKALADWSYEFSDENFTVQENPNALSVTSPNGGETWYKGNSYTITWNTGGLGGNVAIGLYKNGVYTCAVTGTTANDGSYYWTVPTAVPSGSDYKVKIKSLVNSSYDFSDENFTVQDNQNALRVTSPNGGETWFKGSTYTITWNTGGLGGNVAIGLYKNGVYTCAVTGTTANDGSYYWTVPAAIPSGTDYKVKIKSLVDLAYDFSDENFTVQDDQNALSVTSPNGGETWFKGSVYTITWNTGGLSGNVAIGLYKNGVYTCAVTGTTANDGSYYWTVPTAIPSGTDYKVKIKSLVNSSYDFSDGNISITGTLGTSGLSSSSNYDILADGNIGKIALVNPDYYRTVKMGSFDDEGYFYSVSSGTVLNGIVPTDPTETTNSNFLNDAGTNGDFIATVLTENSFNVVIFEADDLPHITASDYDVVIVQDPLRTNMCKFKKESENSLPDLLEYTTDELFLDKINEYFNSGGEIILIGDAVRLMENGENRLNWGKNIEQKSVANNLSQIGSILPNHWIFIGGSSFCGIDLYGSGQYTVTSNSLLNAGSVISELSLFNGGDVPYGSCWSDTVYYPSDGISILSINVGGTGQYVLREDSFSPPVYQVSVDENLSNFMGYTNYNGRKVYYIGSDSFFDYLSDNYGETLNAGQHRSIENVVRDNGKEAICKLIYAVINNVELSDSKTEQY